MNKDKLMREAARYRKEILQMVYRAQKGHAPSCFSMAELLIYFFKNNIINLNKNNINSSNRDKIIISKGHAAMGLYPIYRDLGIVSDEDIKNFATENCLLRLYADPTISGIETVTGSLGNGFGIAAGIALAEKKLQRENKIYTILGDGECYEGSVWESAIFIAHHNLKNLITIVDRNNLSILGNTEEQLKLDSLEDKWKSFGFKTFSIDGHSFEDLDRVFKNIGETEKPICIILNTVKGKGVSYMENDPLWHNRIPNNSQFADAISELEVNFEK